ncbi:unnamed protein product [Urochloa humidicola]
MDLVLHPPPPPLLLPSPPARALGFSRSRARTPLPARTLPFPRPLLFRFPRAEIAAAARPQVKPAAAARPQVKPEHISSEMNRLTKPRRGRDVHGTHAPSVPGTCAPVAGGPATRAMASPSSCPPPASLPQTGTPPVGGWWSTASPGEG